MNQTLGFVIVALMLGGCVSSYNRPADYDKVWDATERVLSRHNLIVQDSLYREDTMVAVSRVHGDFLNKTRVKVVARVERGEEGYAEPKICVLNQMDNSDAIVRGQPEYQTGERWINVSRNAAMEARFYNEIQDEMGKSNPYEGKAWQPPYNEGKLQEMSVRPMPLTPYDE